MIVNSSGLFYTLDEIVVIYGGKVLDVTRCVQDINI